MGNQWALTFFAFLSRWRTSEYRTAQIEVRWGEQAYAGVRMLIVRGSEEIDLLDLRQVESRREQLEALRRDGIEFSERSS
jgi:hypothetical protein